MRDWGFEIGFVEHERIWPV